MIYFICILHILPFLLQEGWGDKCIIVGGKICYIIDSMVRVSNMVISVLKSYLEVKTSLIGGIELK